MLGGAGLDVEDGLLCSLPPNLDIVDIQIDDGVLVAMGAEELVLLLHLHPLIGLDSCVVESL